MREDNTIDIDKMIAMGEHLKEEHPEMFDKALEVAKHCIASGKN